MEVMSELAESVADAVAEDASEAPELRAEVKMGSAPEEAGVAVEPAEVTASVGAGQ